MRRGPAAPETLEIVDLSHDGRGVARAEGKVVFVDGGLPGETVMARRVGRRRSHDEAEVLEVLGASADRVEPGCPHFGTCGGCSLQHLHPAVQLETRSRVLAENLRRIGDVEPAAWFEPLRGPVWRYRRRARLGVRYVHKKGRVLVGFRERYKPYIAELDACPVLAPPADRLIHPLAELVQGLSLRTRLPQVEVGVGDDRTALVFRLLDPPTADDLERLRAFGADHDLDVWLQEGGPGTARPLDPDAGPLVYRLARYDLELEFLPTDFIQVNARLNARMVDRAVALLDLRPGERVLDLFCGLGNFTLPFARRGARATGVEGDAGLVGRSRANARRNGLGEVEFHAADLAADCRGLPWLRREYDALFLDPPRAGADEILPVAVATGPTRVVYVSCHPATLARDAGRLVHEHGYRLAGAGVMDMFPHTAHVESIALFERGAA